MMWPADSPGPITRARTVGGACAGWCLDSPGRLCGCSPCPRRRWSGDSSSASPLHWLCWLSETHKQDCHLIGQRIMTLSPDWTAQHDCNPDWSTQHDSVTWLDNSTWLPNPDWTTQHDSVTWLDNLTWLSPDWTTQYGSVTWLDSSTWLRNPDWSTQHDSVTW